MLLGLLTGGPAFTAETLDLTGIWRQQLDPGDVGRNERWFERTLTGTMKLPGSLEENRIGEPVNPQTKWTASIIDKSYFTAAAYAPYREPGNIKVPFFLQPETRYVGAAWFQRDVPIPANWTPRHIALILERPHWKTAVWLDGRSLGTADSLSVAHKYDLGADLASGNHVLTVRVDNTVDPDIGVNSHSITDHTQGNWNGIAGRIELTATASPWIDDLQVYPRITDRVAVVRGHLARSDSAPWPTIVRLASAASATPAVEATVASDGSFTAEFPCGAQAALWDEFTPALQEIAATLENGERRAVSFGFRAVAAEGPQLTLNGRKIFLRGTLECAAFPRTGHPPTDVAAWEHELTVIKAHGLNQVRFHSWCPPEAAFAAADKLGVYFLIEAASFPNWSIKAGGHLGDGQPFDAWLEAETGHILRAYGNHPSFLMFCACTEPEGPHSTAWLAAWDQRQRTRDPRHLYTAGAGWPEVPENDFHVTPEPRIQHTDDQLASRINRFAPETRTDYRDYVAARTAPVVAHEMGQWCAYPNFAEMPKYTGYLKPRNFEIFRATLEAHGMGDQARDFVHASGKLQALCYKEDIEAALRTPGLGGFDLLGLSDFPGQGTSPVGVLDVFWEDKDYISPAEFRRFCGPTVPLARLDRRVFTSDDHLVAEVEVAHYGATPLPQATATWKLVSDDGRALAQGAFAPRDIPIGGGIHLGRVDLALESIPAPARYRLVVAIDGVAAANDWDVWVYPRANEVIRPVPAPVNVISRLDEAAAARLAAGATLVLMIPPPAVAPDPQHGNIAAGFSSIFWNTAWFHGRPPHTLGVLCDPRHPALAGFPTDAFSNWQWWYVTTQATPMILDALPRELRPVVQVIDDWFTNRKLALVLEARVGTGRLLITSIDLSGSALDPVRRQLRASLLAYAASPRFQPDVTLTTAQVRSLVAQQP